MHGLRSTDQSWSRDQSSSRGLQIVCPFFFFSTIPLEIVTSRLSEHYFLFIISFSYSLLNFKIYRYFLKMEIVLDHWLHCLQSTFMNKVLIMTDLKNYSIHYTYNRSVVDFILGIKNWKIMLSKNKLFAALMSMVQNITI